MMVWVEIVLGLVGLYTGCHAMTKAEDSFDTPRWPVGWLLRLFALIMWIEGFITLRSNIW